MPKFALSSIALLLVGSVLVAAPQKRVKKTEAADFPALLTSASDAWKAGRYAACIGQLKQAVDLATVKRTEVILAALPTALEGWTAEPDTAVDALKSNPFASAMMSAIGNVIKRTYKQDSGRGRVQVSVTADSPLVSMFQMWVANPAMLEQGSELIEYGEHRAVLKPQSGGLNLQILISGKHVCEVQASKLTEEELFRMFSQETVDRLSAALSK